MKEVDEEQVKRELENLQSLQIFFNGYEANALILAVQAMQASSLNCQELTPLLHTAKIAALKLQNLFVLCPATFSAIEQGWQSSRKENFPAEDFPAQDFPPESFVL